jgi:NAD(P)-dependent dehydrogenase (short-subunit alcohol dehydrogenase family)
VATLFASEGANVVLAEMDEERGEKVTQDILKQGGQSVFVKTNVAVEEDVKTSIKAALDSYGKLDIVINNAGLGADYPSWEEVIRVNVQGVYYGCKHGIEAMLKGDGGAIISTSTAWTVYDEDDEASLRLKTAMKEELDDWAQSLIGLVNDSMAAYLLSKRMVNHITRYFAMETAKRNVRVNAIAPGWVTTEGMGRPLTESEEAYKKHSAVMPMNRLATPEEIARVDLFLVSDDASFITGAILPVDGGYSASQRLQAGN